MPDADDQKLGVGVCHGLEQLTCRIDPDRLGELEFDPAVREMLLDVVHSVGCAKPAST
jgi:hypothetical protein